MTFQIEIERKRRRSLLAYGKTRREAIEQVKALALRVVADQLERGERVPQMNNVFTVVS
jgi:hypothetical protein